MAISLTFSLTESKPLIFQSELDHCLCPLKILLLCLLKQSLQQYAPLPRFHLHIFLVRRLPPLLLHKDPLMLSFFLYRSSIRPDNDRPQQKAPSPVFPQVSFEGPYPRLPTKG